MWKAAAGQSFKVDADEGGDDWETDPDFEVLPHLLLFPAPSTLVVLVIIAFPGFLE